MNYEILNDAVYVLVNDENRRNRINEYFVVRNQVGLSTPEGERYSDNDSDWVAAVHYVQRIARWVISCA